MAFYSKLKILTLNLSKYSPSRQYIFRFIISVLLIQTSTLSVGPADDTILTEKNKRQGRYSEQ